MVSCFTPASIIPAIASPSAKERSCERARRTSSTHSCSLIPALPTVKICCTSASFTWYLFNCSIVSGCIPAVSSGVIRARLALLQPAQTNREAANAIVRRACLRPNADLPGVFITIYSSVLWGRRTRAVPRESTWLAVRTVSLASCTEGRWLNLVDPLDIEDAGNSLHVLEYALQLIAIGDVDGGLHTRL